jgi:4'-phosphopantetheinyl transferase EntD
LLDEASSLTHDEQGSITSVPTMTPERLTEFLHGRKHARQALAQLGVNEPSIPTSADRAPVWPQGFVGSISHVPADVQHKQSGWVIAAVARSEHCCGLGIDLERTDSLMPEHWSLYMTTQELAWIALQPPSQRNHHAHGFWSAKEAAMKALTRPLDPHCIEIRVRDGGLSFDAKCCIPNSNAIVETVSMNGWLAFENDWVLALATRQPRQE